MARYTKLIFQPVLFSQRDGNGQLGTLRLITVKGYMRSTLLYPTRLAAIFLAVHSVAIRGANFPVANGDEAGFIAAVEAANATPQPDTISLAKNGDYAFTHSYPTANPENRTALPIITSPVTIEGNGAVIRRASFAKFRLLRASAAGNLTLRKATVRDGDLPYAEISIQELHGSGLRNDGGALTIEHCRFENNKTSRGAAGIYTTGPTVVTDSKFTGNFSSGGFSSTVWAGDTSTVTIERCEFVDNFTETAVAIMSVDDAEIARCSFINNGNNVVFDYPGQIHTAGSVLRVANCTITDGDDTGIGMRGGLLHVTHCTITNHGNGGHPSRGILVTGGFLTLTNSIVAFNNKNEWSADCYIINNGTLVNNTGNLISDGSCNPDFSGDPKLGLLGYHGGTTKVFPLLKGSQAIDNGNDLYSEPIDQRGVARPIGVHCDIGAYEGTKRQKATGPQVDLVYSPKPYIIICDPWPFENIGVSVVGTPAVPARSIDLTSLTLGNTAPGSARVIGIGDVNRDGIEDLTVEFQLADVYRGAFSCADVTLLELQGETVDRQPLAGYINVVAVER